MKQQTQNIQLLLLQDVYNLGRKGDIVRAKPGYMRNFLLPQQKAVVADTNTLRMRAKLQEERAKQAEVDRKHAEELASLINDKSLSIEVKVDLDGHLYGSVTAADIVKMLAQHNIIVEKQSIHLTAPIKRAGVYSIALRLKEGVPATFTLTVRAEGEVAEAAAKQSFTPNTR